MTPDAPFPGRGSSSDGPGNGASVRLTDVAGLGGAPAESATRGVTLQILPGQTVALVGKPGAVAVDLLDVVGGLRRPASGTVLVDEIAVERLRGPALDRFRAQRGLVTPRFPLLFSLSVHHNVLAGQLPRRVDAAMRERAARLLEITGAAPFAAEPADALSAEQTWRVLIARALVPVPALVLAEDPAPSMDARAARAVLDVLLDAHDLFGFTLLLTISAIATASRCERLVTIVDGVVDADESSRGDDAWTRGRIDRIG